MTGSGIVSYHPGHEADKIMWQLVESRKGPVAWHNRVVSTTWDPAQCVSRVALANQGVRGKEIFRRQYDQLVKHLIIRMNSRSHGECIAHLEKMGNELVVSVVANTSAVAMGYLSLLIDDAPSVPQKEPGPDRVFMDFMHLSPRGIKEVTKEIEAPSWNAAEGNYPLAVREKLASVISAGPGSQDGHLGILHGPPGTGKTSFLRALAREWQKEAVFTYVVDPENLFNDGSYLMNVLLSDEDYPEDSPDSRWEVIICEDAEEYLADNAKQDVGQAVARLLNVGDGMLGQGLKTLIIFTTNVESRMLNPAIIRPGRCFMNAGFQLFGRDEAALWLRSHDAPDTVLPDGQSWATLAELYQMLRSAPRSS